MEKNAQAVDPQALERALRALGMLYGARLPDEARRGSLDEAIRAFILRERAHLLAAYDMDALIAMVRAAMDADHDGTPVVEQFGPAR
jgi:hypothetical protein